jgi:hypothetical protein
LPQRIFLSILRTLKLSNMRHIDETQFLSYTVDCGFTVTLLLLREAIKFFNDREGRCTIYGNKSDGTRAILDQK